jgi:3-hydroxybutyryl-CoA dehydrogenase
MEREAARMVVGVVGAGTMGAGIAQVALQAGHEVLLHDVDPEAIQRGRERISAGLQRLVDRGTLDAAQRATYLAALRDVASQPVVAAEADLIVEAALEDLTLKRTIFRQLDMNALPDVPLATNTSALSVAAVAEATHHRERVLGMHFFNPAPVMSLVEVVATRDTAASVIKAAVEFATGLGKTAVVCDDSPGFIVNRVNRAFTLEPLRMLESGVADIQAIDAAIEAAGYPMGPFRLMDLVGIDVNLAVARSLFEGFDEASRFRPSPVQEAIVRDGRLGRKTNHGFYRYAADGTPAAPDPVPGHPRRKGARSGDLDSDAIVERVDLAIINEAYRAVEERVASAGDIDLALKLGANHPLGPFERAGQIGLRAVVEGLRRLLAETAETSGDQYEIAPLLWQIATV